MSDSADKLTRLERVLKRERAARKQAEQLLETRARELFLANQQLEEAYASTVEVFASIIGGRNGRTSESMRRLAKQASALGRRLGLGRERAQTVYLAAALCDLGKLALPDVIVEKTYLTLSRKERQIFQTHPDLAYEALIALPKLEPVADTIRCHCEHQDGKGYPRRLGSEEIPLEAAVLSVVKDFDALRCGILVEGELTDGEAVRYLLSHRSKRYAAAVVDEFVTMLEEQAVEEESREETRLTPLSLRAGMMVTRDLLNDNGVLILPAGRVLNEATVEKLRAIGKERATDWLIYVAESGDAESGKEPAATDNVRASVQV